MTRGNGDRGQVGGIEVLPFGVLVFITGILFVSSVWAVVDARFAVDDAARAAAQTLVETPGTTGDAHALAGARAAATRSMTGSGKAGTPEITIAVDGPALGRCVAVAVTVRYEVPAVRAPFLGSAGPPIAVTATHRTIVDPLRSGVAGEATCIT